MGRVLAALVGFLGDFDLAEDAAQEASGLLALMPLHDSRRTARFRERELVLLTDQDKTLWDGEQIEAGRVQGRIPDVPIF